MDKNDVEKIERAIESGEYKYGDIEKLPGSIQRQLSEIKADLNLEKAQSKIDYEPRDWSKAVEFQDCYITGIHGEEMAFVSHLFIRSNEEAVIIEIASGPGNYAYEKFRTKEKLDSFIEALSQARDEVFGNKEILETLIKI